MADLTTLALVKLHGGLGDDNDTLLNQLIDSVSRQMEADMVRTIALVSGVVRIYRPPAGVAVIVLDEWPVASTVVTEDSAALVLNTDYEILDDRRMVRISGDAQIAWASGAKVSVTATEGYSTIPTDIDLAAREAVRLAYMQTKVGGDRLGDGSVSSPTGDQVTFTLGWPESVQRVIDRHRRPIL